MTDPHDAIYDILIRECGAIEHNRERFRAVDLTEPNLRGYIFGGQLGLEGRLVIDGSGHWFVTMHPEDQTPKRTAMMTRANAALVQLQGR